MNKKLEIRNISVDIRALEEGSRKISGLAIPVESRSGLIREGGYEFYETISTEALSQELIDSQDIKLYLNHDRSQGTYARSKYGQGSLRLFITERGIEFETVLPNTVFGDTLLEGIRRGDYDALSFCFSTDRDEWSKNNDGTYNRIIRSIDFIDEISILSCTPAYAATEVNLRSLEKFNEEEKQKEEAKKSQLLASLDAKLKEIDEISKT